MAMAARTSESFMHMGKARGVGMALAGTSESWGRAGLALAGIAQRRVTPAVTWARPVGRVGSASAGIE